jgi:carbon-monoxide dehydrogenase large subunit
VSITVEQPASLGGQHAGQPVERREDFRFLTGRARFTEDLAPAGLLHASIVRSPYPHARIVSVGTGRAGECPGVVAVLTEADFPGEQLPAIPTDWVPPVMTHIPTRYALARDRVRFVGEAVAVVVAETRAQAEDAAELVDVEYEPLPFVVDAEAALGTDAPVLHEDFPGNQAFQWHLGATTEAVDAALAQAEVVLRLRLENQRVAAAPTECRGALADYDAGTGRLRLHTGTQNVHVVRRNLSRCTGIPEHLVQVVSPAVGGSFGSKLCLYPEGALVAVLSRRLERPVRWIETRSENFTATSHGRAHVEHVTVGATRDGKITALKSQTYVNLGAYVSGMGAGIPCVFPLMLGGCYDIPLLSADVLGSLTNTTTTDTYRGAGRPEAAYLVERAVDAVAAELGLDPVETRRHNFIQPHQFPYQSAIGFIYDSGDYGACLDKALGMLDHAAARAQQDQARAAGRLVGIGVACYAEFCGLGDGTILGLDRSAWEQAVVAVSRTGKVTVQVGVVDTGQGHQTTIGQLVAGELGLPLDDVDVVQGDTDLVTYGSGSFNSRSISNAGSAAVLAAGKVLAKARKVAAHLLQADPDDVVYADQRFTVAGSSGAGVSFAEVSQATVQGAFLPAGLEPGLKEMALYKPPNFTAPFGTHLAMVEVDPDTGVVDILRYVAVDDCGTIINPLLAAGQVHGAIAQGLGQAMSEHLGYDENGQPTGSLLEYAVPRAHQMPRLETGHTVTPTPYNPLGAKGIGESGAMGSPPALVNAVLDALRPVGVRHLDMPLTPPRVWAAIQDAKGARP